MEKLEPFDINTWEIFTHEFEFWATSSVYRYPKYSYEFAHEVENIVIEHFKSNLPVKMNHSPEYDIFINKRAFSFLDKSVINESPYEFIDEEDKFSDEKKKIIKLFSRLTVWTDDFVIRKEQIGDAFFEIMFAFSLRQCDITNMYSFLEYHLISNFQNRKSDLIRYLKPLTNKYRDILFYDALTETIYDWIDLQNPKLIQKHETISAETTLHSFQLYNSKDEENLVNVLNGLKKYRFVADNTTLPNFKKLFKGEYNTAPVIWTGNISELKHFVKVLHLLKKKIKPLPTEIWKITAKCFVPPEGGRFDWKLLKGQKKPKNAALLETISDSL